MARLMNLLALTALALVCGAASVSSSVPAAETGLHHRVRRFSLEGVVECLAMMGIFGMAELNNVVNDCEPLGVDSLQYRLCFFKKIANLGPDYAKCVIES